jgi:hypothetical protein
MMLRYHEDELGVALKAHLLIEYVLDLMIKRGLREPKPVLSDHKSYPFSIKTRLLYEAGHLPTCAFRNVLRVNRVRNELAHSLSLNSDKMDFKFDLCDGGFAHVLDLREHVNPVRNPAKKYLQLLCLGTLGQVQRAYHDRFGAWPLFDQPP